MGEEFLAVYVKVRSTRPFRIVYHALERMMMMMMTKLVGPKEHRINEKCYGWKGWCNRETLFGCARRFTTCP